MGSRSTASIVRRIDQLRGFWNQHGETDDIADIIVLLDLVMRDLMNAARPGLGRPPAFDRAAHQERNTVGRAFGQLRAVATRCDKRGFVWRGTVDVTSIRISLGHPVQ